jgi:hypothetical protein
LAARVSPLHHAVRLCHEAKEIDHPVHYRGGASRQRSFQATNLPNETFNLFLGTFNLAWEIDVWGRRIRRATESARAEYLAAEGMGAADERRRREQRACRQVHSSDHAHRAQ